MFRLESTRRIFNRCGWNVSKMFYSSILFQNERMKVLQIPIFEDNYSYLLVDKKYGNAAAIDPAEPSTICSVMDKENVTLTDILTTHHHWDHAGGNEELIKIFPHVRVFGGEKSISGLNSLVKEGDNISFGGYSISVLETPCHTAGHIVYFIKNNSPPILFSGDTLFIGGCGRFFEGTASQMAIALLNKLSVLPKDTLVCCGHEYTISNLEFAQYVEPSNKKITEKLEWARKKREKNESTVPSTIGEELEYNPFMRVNSKEIRNTLNLTSKCSNEKVIGKLRDMKNSM